MRVFRLPQVLILAAIILIFSAVADAANYAYDNLGRLISVTYNNGQKINFEYDAGGNIKRVIVPDSISPIVSSIDPANGLTGVAVNKSVEIKFSEAVNQGVYFRDIRLKNTVSNTVVDYTYSLSSNTLTLNPVNPLDYNVTYAVYVPAGAIKDNAGNPLAKEFISTFITEQSKDMVAPSVYGTDPVNGAVGVPINKQIKITFSEAVQEGANTNGITLKTGETVVDYTYGITGNVLTITPLSDLNYGSNYTVLIPSGAVNDLAGNTLAEGCNFGFTTGNAPDTTPPNVSSTDPSNNSTNVPINKQINVTFSETIQAGANISGITLKNGSTLVDYTYGISGSVLTITPSSNLSYSVAYSVYVPSGAINDLAGNELGSSTSWSFTTGNAPDTTPPSMSSTDPSNNATNVPINKQISVTFSEAIQAGVNINGITLKNGSTSVSYTYGISGSVLTITPSSNLSYSVAYSVYVPGGAVNDLAGNELALSTNISFTTGSTPDTTPPNVSSTDPANNATNVPTNKQINVTFSKAIQAGANINGITLKNGSTPIDYTYGISGSVLTITPLSNLSYSVAYSVYVPSGAINDLAGNELATSISFGFTTGSAPDTTPPNVSSTDPANNVTNVPINKQINVSFSEAIQSGANISGITLKNGSTPVDYTYGISGNVLTITPSSNLSYSVAYSVYVPSGAINDLAGNELATSTSWDFTTGNAPDTTPPNVSSSDPANNATNVPINKQINVTFSEAIQSGANISGITLKNGSTPVDYTYGISGSVLTITPASNLSYSVAYSVYVPGGAVSDLAGNELTTGINFSFTTGIAPDTSPPSVSSTDPSNNVTNIPINKQINLNFSEAIQAGVNINGITLKNGSIPVDYTYGISGSVLTITPSSNLNYSVAYSVYVPSGAINDLAGNELATSISFGFTTGSAPDSTPPSVSSTNPANNATNVSINKQINVSFSEAIQAGANINGITLKNGSTPISYSYGISGNVLTITPPSNLSYSVSYAVYVPAGALNDLAGNSLSTSISLIFTTEAATGPGTGTAADPYMIYNTSDLQNIKNNLTACYKLANDIDMTGVSYVPIGNSTTPFKGTLDGNGYTVKNLTINGTGIAGLFGYTTDATIQNLNITVSKVTSTNSYVGALMGYATGTTKVSNIKIRAVDGNSVVSGVGQVGGLAGYFAGLNITNCSSNVNVSSSSGSYVGGLVGSYAPSSVTGVIDKCYVTGNVTGGTGNYIGGLVGYVTSGTISNSYALGNVSGTSAVGGFVGVASGSSTKLIKITNCYSVGQVTTSISGGGLVSSFDSYTTITSSYYDAVTAKQNVKAASDVAQSRLTNAMVKQGNYVGWDLTSTWAIDEGSSYPYLRNMEKPSGVTAITTLNSMAGGSGSVSDPYLISTPQQFQNMMYELNAYYKLANDIDMTGISHVPIGKNGIPFKGTLDGNGYAVKNLTINGTDMAGLFGYTTDATIQNLNITVSKVTSTNSYVGALMGYATGTTKVSNIKIRAVDGNSVVSGVGQVGGLAGYFAGLNITNCSSNVNVSSSSGSYVGGLVGSYAPSSVTGVIDKCYVIGNVTGGTGSYIGGLVGYVTSGTISNSYALGNVSGTSAVGGFVGVASGSSTKLIKITNCYSVGQVSASSTGGGLIGSLGSYTTITSSYFDSSAITGGNSYGTAMTHDASLHQLTYIGFDFNVVWAINEGVSTPYLP